MQKRPIRGLDTSTVLRLLRRLVGLTLPEQTLDRWLHNGMVVASVVQSRTRGRSHRWSAADVVLIAWLLTLRRDGFDVHRYAGHLRSVWSRLTTALDASDPRYVVALGSTVAVLGHSDLCARLTTDRTGAIVAWRAPSLAEVRHQAQLEGFGDVP